MRTKLKKITKPKCIALILVLIGIFVFACIGLYNNSHYSEKELKEIREELRKEILENPMWKEGIVGVGTDYEKMVITVDITRDCKNKEQIKKEITKKYGNAVCVTIVDYKTTVT